MAIQSPSIDIAGAAPVGPALAPVTRGYWQSVRRRLRPRSGDVGLRRACCC